VNFDIIEGPVVDDAIATRIAFYLRGGISKKDFLEDLKFKHSKSHQLAFCTEKSLLMLNESWDNIDLIEFTIDESILQSLVDDFELTEEKAIDLYFQSETYQKIIDPKTNFFKKNWKDLYSILCNELNLNHSKI